MITAHANGPRAYNVAQPISAEQRKLDLLPGVGPQVQPAAYLVGHRPAGLPGATTSWHVPGSLWSLTTLITPATASPSPSAALAVRFIQEIDVA